MLLFMFILLFLLEKFRAAEIFLQLLFLSENLTRAVACNTAFSVSCVNTVSVLSLAQTSENTLREFPLVIATVAKVSRKRGLWLVVRVNKRRCVTSYFP